MKKLIVSSMLILNCLFFLSGCGKTNSSDIQGTEVESADSAGGEALADVPTLKDVYILPQELENPNLTIVWDASEDDWNYTKENDPNAFNLVWSTKEAFERMYGGTVNVIGVGWGEMINQTYSMVEKGEACDLVQANDQNFPRYANDGIVQDVSKYVDLNDDFWYDNVTRAFTFGGVPYAMGADANPVVISYNKTMFEEKGVKTPREYFEEDNWTWDTFREVGMKMTQDVDNDGETDIYGFSWWDSFWVQLLNADGGTSLSYDDAGIVYSNYMTDKAMETFEFVQKSFVEDKYMIIPMGDSFVNDFKSGKLAMTCEYGFAAKTLYECDYEIDWAPLPKGPSGEKYESGGSIAGFAIPVTSTNPEGAAAFARMAYELQLDYNRRQRVEKFGLQEVGLMSELSKHINFSPIGVDNYWDAQGTISMGLADGRSIKEITKEADQKIKDGIKQ